jgi:DNA-binding response OmpR family regulator
MDGTTTSQERALIVGGRRPRVLVVDDNRDAADSLRLLLRLWGFESRAAYDGAEGLAAAYAYLPDCLVLDIGLPSLDGYALARRIRQHPRLAGAKLVALSAYSDELHIRRTQEAGFDHRLVKPANLSELKGILDMLDEVIRLTYKTEELTRQNVVLATQTKELLHEVKEEIKEVKQEVQGVKAAVKELKEELREVKERETEADESGGGA